MSDLERGRVARSNASSFQCSYGFVIIPLDRASESIHTVLRRIVVREAALIEVINQNRTRDLTQIAGARRSFDVNRNCDFGIFSRSKYDEGGIIGTAGTMLCGTGFCTDINAQIDSESFIDGKYILAQKGKKNYFLIKIH